MVAIPLWVVVITIIVCILLGASIVITYLDNYLKIGNILLKSWKECADHHAYIQKILAELVRCLKEGPTNDKNS